jgi:hypothetical protein
VNDGAGPPALYECRCGEQTENCGERRNATALFNQAQVTLEDQDVVVVHERQVCRTGH